MKKIYYGEIKKFDNMTDINLIEIVHFGKEQFEPHKSLYVEPKAESTRLALNHYITTFKPSKMVVNYIRREPYYEQIGLKRFREFNLVELEKNTIINYEVYEVLPPFILEEYYDGKFLYLIFKDLNFNISLLIDGITCRISDTIYRCYFNTENLEVIIKGDNFLVNHKPSSALEKDMKNIQITTYSDFFIVTVNLNKLKCAKFDESDCADFKLNSQFKGFRDHSSRSDKDSSVEEELKNFTIVEDESNKVNGTDLKYYNLNNDKLEFNTDIIDKDNYYITQETLMIRLYQDKLYNNSFNLNIGKLKIQLEKGKFLLDRNRVELLKARDMYTILEKLNDYTH